MNEEGRKPGAMQQQFLVPAFLHSLLTSGLYGRTITLPLPSIHFSVAAVYVPAGFATPPMVSAFTINSPRTPSGESVRTLLFAVIVRVAAFSWQPLRWR